jgi:hypothetical protein
MSVVSRMVVVCFCSWSHSLATYVLVLMFMGNARAFCMSSMIAFRDSMRCLSLKGRVRNHDVEGAGIGLGAEALLACLQP